MSICENCRRRTTSCHADCADYLAEHIVGAPGRKTQAERDADDYAAHAVYMGGRRKSGSKIYKGRRTAAWRIMGGHRNG